MSTELVAGIRSRENPDHMTSPTKVVDGLSIWSDDLRLKERVIGTPAEFFPRICRPVYGFFKYIWGVLKFFHNISLYLHFLLSR
jgi:hypothetical protein